MTDDHLAILKNFLRWKRLPNLRLSFNHNNLSETSFFNFFYDKIEYTPE